MAGSPRKRARRLGLPLPNAGDKPPKHPRARPRATLLDEPLLPDAELEALAKRALTHVMLHGADDKDRVAAARAMLEARRRAGSPADAEAWLEHLSSDELERKAAEAEAMVRGGPVQ